MARSLAQRATSNLKRISMTNLNTRSPLPASPTFYITVCAEMRTDVDLYMFSVDKCYTTLEQANERVQLLGDCNVSSRVDAALRNQEETTLKYENESDGLILSIGRPRSRPRFVAYVHKIETGESMTRITQNMALGSLTDISTRIGAFLSATELDLSEHVWVVVTHAPVFIEDSTLKDRPKSFMRTSQAVRPKPSIESSLAAMKSRSKDPFTRVASERRPIGTGWLIDSVYNTSDKALARAKTLWNERFKEDHGRCQKIREHFGFARFAFKPASISEKDLESQTCVQIRVERVRVVPVDDRPEYNFMPLSGKQALRSPPVRVVDGELISTEAGYRTSFVNDIERIVDVSFNRLAGLGNQKYEKASDSALEDQGGPGESGAFASEEARELYNKYFDCAERETISPAPQEARAETAGMVDAEICAGDMEMLRIPAEFLQKKPSRAHVKPPAAESISAAPVDPVAGKQVDAPPDAYLVLARVRATGLEPFNGLWM